MNLKIKYKLYSDILVAIERSIDSVRNMQEPDYVAALVTKLPGQLSQLLQNYFPGNNFRVGGCFIHQKPLAKFFKPDPSNPKSPEIGDLLIVYKEINPTGTTYHNALLLQAKKTSNIYNTPISLTDTHQLRLYKEWPKFKYERAGVMNGTVRSISPKTITPGAQYLLINEVNQSYPFLFSTFWCAKPNDVLVASNSLAHKLIDLIEFQTGRPFAPRKGNIDQWSKMIWDLLKISSNAVFNRRNAGFKSCNRTSGDIVRTSGDIINMLIDSVDYKQNHNDFDDNSIGISVLIIERDNRERNRYKSKE